MHNIMIKDGAGDIRAGLLIDFDYAFHLEPEGDGDGDAVVSLESAAVYRRL